MVKLKKNSFLKLRLQGKYLLAIFALVAWVVLLLSTILLYHFIYSMEIISSTSARMSKCPRWMATGLHKEMQSLAEQIRMFDFDDASVTLSAMAKLLNVPLDRLV